MSADIPFSKAKHQIKLQLKDGEVHLVSRGRASIYIAMALLQGEVKN